MQEVSVLKLFQNLLLFISERALLCLTIVLKTWNVDNVEIRSYFIILISGFLSVFLYLKKKLHHFIKNCKSIVFSRLAEKKTSDQICIT